MNTCLRISADIACDCSPPHGHSVTPARDLSINESVFMPLSNSRSRQDSDEGNEAIILKVTSAFYDRNRREEQNGGHQ